MNITPYGKSFYYLTYRDKIQNFEGYIFQKYVTAKKFWDGLPV